MNRFLRQTLHLVLALSIALITPYPLSAQTANHDFQPSPQEAAQIKYDLNLLYFSQIKEEMPHVAALAFDEDLKVPTWKVTGNNPLLDNDPFFMRSQSWTAVPARSECTDARDGSLCVFKDANSITLVIGGVAQALKIDQRLNAVLETNEHVFLMPDDNKLFAIKSQDANEPGEGVFFIAKKDLLFANGRPVPLFFFPLPGEGWTGQNRLAADFQFTDQVVFYDKDNFGLPIEGHDLALMEKTQRQNLVLATTFAILDGPPGPGAILPKPNTTMAYGLFLSGQTTRAIDGFAHNETLQKKFETAAAQVAREILPVAHAHDSSKTPSTSEKIDAQVEKRAEQLKAEEGGYDWAYWKRWLINGVLWGGFGAAAYATYSPIDFSNMITAEMPNQIATVAKIIGAVAVASIVMKYTIHRAHFKKLYPVRPDDSLLQRLNQEHKGIMSELAYGLYFSLASIPNALRHGLAFLKERFIPRNKMIAKAWDYTMGYQMRQSSRLPMNYKTQYLGWVLGLADCVQVFVFLMILGPWFMNATGFQLNLGAATAAFASSEVLRNCLSYLQTGAFGYSSEVKFIAMGSAEAAARLELQRQNKNPDAAANKEELHSLVEKHLELRYKTVGLPGKEEFLYDPVTVIEGIGAAAGYQSEAAKNAMPKAQFALESGNWGYVTPALKQALTTARDIQEKNPSRIGAQTVRHLERALNERSLTTPVMGRLWDVSASRWGYQGMRKAAGEELTKYWRSIYDKQKELETKREALEAQRKATQPLTFDLQTQAENIEKIDQQLADLKDVKPTRLGNALAYMKGAFTYIVKDSTKWPRAIRETLFTMSNTAKSKEAYSALPALWKEKAESEEAATISAEMFHRSFFSLYEHNDNLITPAPAIEHEFTRAANAAIDKAAKEDATLNDPFVREMRRRELVYRFKLRQQARREALEYKPAAIGKAEEQKWELARATADEVWAEQSVATPDRVWDEMYQTHRELTDPPKKKKLDENGNWIEGQYLDEYVDPNFNPISQQAFSASYRYKMLVAQEFAKQVGLTSLTPEQSEFVSKVVVDAAGKTEATLKTDVVAKYIAKLTESERRFYEAQVFSRSFIDSYVSLAVHSADNLKPWSPEYPGIGQRVKRWVVGLPGGGVINGTVRIFEAMFRNEETSYRADWMGWFNRNIPLLPDMWKNFKTNLRVMPYMATLSYLTYFYVWQVHQPYALWLFSMLIMFLNPSFVEVNNRGQKNLDIKPMADVPSKLIYGWTHGIMTNPELIFVQTYAQPIVDKFDRYLVQPIQAIPSLCERALVGTGAFKR